MNVTEALKSRISIRQFTSESVSQELVHEILDVARWSPSGGNVQPWRVIAVSGAERDAVVELAHQSAPDDLGYPVYPANLWEPYRTRRFAVGEDMYALMEIAREDRPARLAHVARNYDFFGAPVGLFFAIDKGMGHGQWAHLGMFMQSVALAATERGLGSCFQEMWAMYRGSLAERFALPDNEMIYCGMALGYPDQDAPVNKLRSTRVEVDEFAEFLGF